MKKIKTTVITTCLLIIAATQFTYSQGLALKRQNYKALSNQMTTLMKTRYHLSSSQVAQLSDFNDRHYLSVTSNLETGKNLKNKSEFIKRITAEREKTYSEILTKEQYASYSKDMDVMRLSIKKKAEELNRNSPIQKIQPKP